MNWEHEDQFEKWRTRTKYLFETGLTPDVQSSWTIDQVPSNWRSVQNNAFDPEMTRIGPLKIWERSMPRLQLMEDHKMRFLMRLLRGKLKCQGSDMLRTTEGERVPEDCEREEDDNGGQMVRSNLLDDLVKAMQILKRESNDFYSKSFHTQLYNDSMFDGCSVFVWMMIIDGCFVIELLCRYYNLFHTKSPNVANADDPILTNPRILTTLRRDLLLLENQLPFSVLKKFYKLINKKNGIDHQQAVPLEVLAVTFFNPLLPQHDAASKLDAKKPKAHLLEVFRSTFLKSVSDKVKLWSNASGSMRGLDLHFASELQEAGVQFEKCKGHDLLDIESSHRTLRVPPLSLNDNTISLLLNFIAYELSINHHEPFFTNYFMFWDSLVNSPRDIQILRKHGIINNLGSEKEVAELLMRCREVIYDLDLGYLYNVIMEVNDYCKWHNESKYHVWWRTLIRERFSSPWTCLSLFAAIFLLLLTFLQTFYTVYTYYRPQ